MAAPGRSLPPWRRLQARARRHAPVGCCPGLPMHVFQRALQAAVVGASARGCSRAGSCDGSRRRRRRRPQDVPHLPGRSGRSWVIAEAVTPSVSKSSAASCSEAAGTMLLPASRLRPDSSRQLAPTSQQPATGARYQPGRRGDRGLPPALACAGIGVVHLQQVMKKAHQSSSDHRILPHLQSAAAPAAAWLARQQRDVPCVTSPMPFKQGCQGICTAPTD